MRSKSVKTVAVEDAIKEVAGKSKDFKTVTFGQVKEVLKKKKVDVAGNTFYTVRKNMVNGENGKLEIGNGKAANGLVNRLIELEAFAVSLREMVDSHKKEFDGLNFQVNG